MFCFWIATNILYFAQWRLYFLKNESLKYKVIVTVVSETDKVTASYLVDTAVQAHHPAEYICLELIVRTSESYKGHSGGITPVWFQYLSLGMHYRKNVKIVI